MTQPNHKETHRLDLTWLDWTDPEGTGTVVRLVQYVGCRRRWLDWFQRLLKLRFASTRLANLPSVVLRVRNFCLVLAPRRLSPTAFLTTWYSVLVLALDGRTRTFAYRTKKLLESHPCDNLIYLQRWRYLYKSYTYLSGSTDNNSVVESAGVSLAATCTHEYKYNGWLAIRICSSNRPLLSRYGRSGTVLTVLYVYFYMTRGLCFYVARAVHAPSPSKANQANCGKFNRTYFFLGDTYLLRSLTNEITNYWLHRRLPVQYRLMTCPMGRSTITANSLWYKV
jgi:hypothetical protein